MEAILAWLTWQAVASRNLNLSVLRYCGASVDGFVTTGTFFVTRTAHYCFLEASDFPGKWNAMLAAEAREMALHAHKLGLDVTPEMFTECFLYYLSLNSQGGNRIDYNWATHASCYWVCDGITGGGQDNKDNQAWELALAVQQHI